MEREPSAGHGSSGRHRYGPVAVETREFRRPVPAVAFDCVKLLLIRDGATVLVTEDGPTRAAKGDLVFLRTAVSCSGTPEESVTISTLYLDTDYLFELWFWQLAPEGHNREALRAHALSPGFLPPLTHLQLGPATAAHVGEVFDDLARILARGAGGFYRAQAFVSELIHVLAPRLGVAPPPKAEPLQQTGRPIPHDREFLPLRSEALVVRRLLHAEPSRRWTMELLAEEVHLSPRHLTRVFSAAFGRAPLVYLTVLRAQEMARLLADTDLTIPAAAERVGWRSRSRAADAFRQVIGVSPDEYRSAARDRDLDMPDPDWDAIERTAG